MNFANVKVFLFIIIIVEVRSQIGDYDVIDGIQGVNNILGDDPIDFNIIDDLSLVDYILEDRPPEITDGENEDSLRVANADPTLHKWKHKRPLFHSHTHSHTHSKTHGNSHGIDAQVYPVNHQFYHQPPSSIYTSNKQFAIVKGHGIEAHQAPLNLDSNHWDAGFQQNSHSTYNQNFNQGNQAIVHQNAQLNNQNFNQVNQAISHQKAQLNNQNFNQGNQAISQQTAQLNNHNFNQVNQAISHQNAQLNNQNFNQGNQPISHQTAQLNNQNFNQVNQAISHQNAQLNNQNFNQGNQAIIHQTAQLNKHNLNQANKAISHQTALLNNQNFNQGNQAISHQTAQLNNQNFNQGNQVISHQTAQLNNQNFNQGNQAINHQTTQLNNQNFNQGNQAISHQNIHPSEALHPKIVNINGHTNTFIHSGTSQNFVSSALPPSDRDDHLIGISKPVEEGVYWQDKPKLSDLQTDSEETITPVVYDREMNNILDILDDRSYYQARPEVKPSGLGKNAEMPTLFQGSQYPDGEPQRGTYEFEQEPKEEPPIEDGPEYTLESPSLIQFPHNNYFHSYDRLRSGRNRRSPRDINMNVLSDNSMVFNISSWRLKEMNSKLDKTLLGYRDVVENYRKKITDKRESLFVDVLESIIGNFGNREYGDSNEIKKVEKRSATITRLLNDPDARLDVPKTLDNIGTITRNAFEDERSPMYHVRQFMGSTKNAVLSAMKIPPQNLVIPSNYEIKNINPEEIEEEGDNLVSGVNPKILSRSGFRNSETEDNFEGSYPSDPYGIVETFARVGGAIRDSVRSGQNTLNHLSDIAHDARKIFHTTKNTVPRVLLPYAKAPVLLSSRFKADKKAPFNKAIIISPKVLQIKDPLTGARKTQPDFVSLGHILDAIGLTKSKKDHIALEKIVLKMPGEGGTRGFYIPPIGEVKFVNGKKLPSFKGGNDKIQQKTTENLGRIKDKVASTNRVVKENIQKMKNDISKTLDESKNKIKYGTLQMKERNNIENDSVILSKSLPQSDESKIKSKKNEIKHFTTEEENQIIDKFLYNIFKTDANQSEPIVSLNNIKERNNYKTESILGSPNTVYIPNFPPNITESVLEETIRNITMDILNDENKDNSYKKYSKSNEIQKNNLKRKKKVNFVKRPKIVLQSRFGDDEDTTAAVLNNEYEDDGSNIEDLVAPVPHNATAPKFKGLDQDEEDEMRKVDEYVLNDLASSDSSNEKAKSSWRMGNILELIEDPSAEESSNELKSGKGEEKKGSPIFSSRNLLSFADTADKQKETMKIEELKRNERSIGNKERVGLNLPPELMKPFMAVAPNSNIDEVFGNEDKEDNEGENSVESATSPKSEISNHEENADEEVLGLNLPPKLMARNSNTNIDKTFTSEEENEYNNNDMQYNSPPLMMPLRTTKSVKKTLDEFLKKENETRQQDNRAKYSRSEDIPDSHEENEEQLSIIPPSDFMRKMLSTVSNIENCRMKRCYESSKNYDVHLPQYVDGSDPQNFVLCVCISEVPHGSVLRNDEFPGYSQYQYSEDLGEDNARKGVGQARTSMVVSENLRKPFMGLGNDENIKKFYEEYNEKMDDGGDLFGSEEERLLFDDN